MAKRPLTQLSRDLQRQFGTAPGYRGAYNAALDGRIPAEQGPNGRWTYNTEDLPAIAAALGLTVQNVAA